MHELDVLRDLADRADEVGRGATHGMARLRVQLLTLLDPDACPVLRVFADANPTPDGRTKYDDLLRETYPSADPRELHPSTAWPLIEAVCMTEIETSSGVDVTGYVDR
jgi:hypothetical protein